VQSPAAQPVRVLLALAATLALLYAVPSRPFVAILLAALWWLLFRPIGAAEWCVAAIAAAFFLVQNYVALSQGLFTFEHQDILLQPYYEPLLWSFYFLGLKRFVAGPGRGPVDLGFVAVVAAVIGALPFSLFAREPDRLLAASAVSTAILLALFHRPFDLAYAGSALGLGFVVEWFGVSTRLWRYPVSDFLGIPYWFATMWITVGVLGGRLLVPAAYWLTDRWAHAPGSGDPDSGGGAEKITAAM
jgi:hypothetical protein